MNPIWVVFRKEMTDSLRDRRSLFSALLFPLVGPLLVAVLFTYLADRERADREVDLPVVGREHAPAFVAELEGDGVRVVDPPADPVAAVKRGDVHLVLVIPDDFGRRFRAGKPAPLEIIVDRSRDEAHSSVQRVKGRLKAMAAQTRMLRLLARGVDPTLTEPLLLTEVDVSTPQRLAARLFGILPMFLLMGAFVGGMYVATDSTAGERERGSLEPLLINPASRTALVAGKWAATAVFATATVLITLAVSLVVLAYVPLEPFGMQFSVTPGDVGWMALAAIPLAGLASAAQLLVATFARSFKEAQAYLSYMIFLPMLPGALLSIMPLSSELWMTAIPVWGQQVLLTDVIRGEALRPVGFVVAAVVALGATAACLLGAARLFERETIIFGR